MNKKRTQWITYNGLLAAIIVVMSLVPFIGYITFGATSIQLISIPVIIGGILFGFKSSLFLSLVFGIFSMFVAATRGGAGDALFVNPLVSVLPRFLFGLSIVPIHSIIKNRIKNSVVSDGLTALLSTLVHSIVVLTALILVLGLNAGALSQTAKAILSITLLFNVLAEAIVSVIVVVPVVKALRNVID